MADDPLIDGILPPPKRSRLRGRVWQIVGTLILIVGLLLTIALIQERTVSDAPATEQGNPMYLLLWAAALAGLCYQRARRHLALVATEVLARDPRPPVIYLRSFQVDKRASKGIHGSRLFGGLLAVLDFKTQEERLVAAFAPFGPVIAVGKPGEKLPALGAARLYISDERWQEVVRGLMDRAAPRGQGRVAALSENVTVTDMMTGTGPRSVRVGAYSHCLTASSAA